MEKKKQYIVPRIEWILLDNNVSLQLESTPPIGPEESINISHPEIKLNNPFNV